MITKDSIETAYSFLHQKRNVYIHSSLDWQKDDIEYAIASYVDDMSQELYEAISNGRADFLRDHKRFQEDITLAVGKLEGFLLNR
jgi:ribose 1,5-bisphosphokinase PhnN